MLERVIALMLECVNHSCVLTLSLFDGLFLGVGGRLLGDGLDHGFLDGDDYAVGNLDIVCSATSWTLP